MNCKWMFFIINYRYCNLSITHLNIKKVQKKKLIEEENFLHGVCYEQGYAVFYQRLSDNYKKNQSIKKKENASIRKKKETFCREYVFKRHTACII